MIETARIATGLAESLLAAETPANPKRTVADAFQRGFRLGLSLRRPLSPPRRRSLPYEKEPRYGL